MYSVANELMRRPLTMDVNRSFVGSIFDPNVFGPAFWFTLHAGAAAYPENPTPWTKNGMKSLLVNFPLLIPCGSPCREHFYAYVKNADLNDVVSTREKLFKFLVDAHNYVNVRYSKPIMTLNDAKSLYGYDNNGRVMRITYN